MATTKKPVKQTAEQKLRKQLKDEKGASKYWHEQFLEQRRTTRSLEDNLAQNARIESLDREVQRLTEFIRWQINPETAEISEQTKVNVDRGMMMRPGEMY